MNSSAIVLTSTLSGYNTVTISVAGNPSQNITINLNTAIVNGFSQLIDLKQLGASEGSLLKMDVTTNGVVNNVYLPFQWTYSSSGGVQILKLEQTNTGTYTATLVSDSNSSSAISTLPNNNMLELFPASNIDKASINATNALNSDIFTSLSPASQIATTPNSTVAGVVQNISNIDAIKTSDSASSNYATNTAALSALVSSTPVAPIQYSNTLTVPSSTFTSSITRPSDSSAVFASNINNLVASPPITMTSRTASIDALAAAIYNLALKTGNVTGEVGPMTDAAVALSSPENVIGQGDTSNTINTAANTALAVGGSNPYVVAGASLANLIGNSSGNLVGQGGSLLNTSSTKSTITSAANTALAVGGSNPYVVAGASLANLIGSFF